MSAKKAGYVGLMEAAQAAWPEDEAYGTMSTFSERMADCRDDEDREYVRGVTRRAIVHMRNVFGRETDAAELIARYNAELVRLAMPAEILEHANA